MTHKCALFAFAAMMSASVAGAAVNTPVFFSENFIKMGQEGDYLTGDWITYGNGAQPDAAMSNFFNADGSGPYYLLLNYGNTTIPVSCTNFTPSTAADQWLVTPEIEIPSDAVELSFTAVVYCNRGAWGVGKNPYKILVSETGGAAKEDFSEVPVLETTVSGSRTQEISMKDVVCPLVGYGGKKVRLAFVSTGQDLGMTGFTNISLSNYAITLDNKTPKVTEVGNSATVSVNVGMKTPVACPGFSAVLDINGQVFEKNYTKSFGNAGNVVIYQLVKFDPIEVTTEETLNYTVTIVPDYEGAPATTLTGSIGVPAMSYPANVVVEEITATGCQACPSGTAAMQYYHDTFPGDENGDGKVIGIAIHGFINYTDPMAAGVQEYLMNVLNLNGTTSYPQAIFNRATRGLMPHRLDEVIRLMGTKSYNKVKINSVTTEATESDPWGKRVRVDFDARNAYDGEGLDLRAVAVMIENKVNGNESGYNQTNGFWNRDESYIIYNYGSGDMTGEFLLPYIRPYLQGGEFGKSIVPFNQMTYNHVARGIWPSFYGDLLEGEWRKDTPRSESIEFNVPETIMDIKNTEVVVLLIDGETQEIVASDIIAADQYVYEGSGVEAPALAGVTVNRHGSDVVVNATAATAEVYTLSGLKVASAAVSGTATLAAPAGPVIVKVTTADGSHACKLN